MKGSSALLYASLIITILFVPVVRADNGELLLTDQSENYVALVKDKKNAFICVVYSREAPIDKKILDEAFSAGYPKALTALDAEQATKEKVSSQTGVQNGGAQNLDSGKDNKDAKAATETNNSQQKSTRVLEGSPATPTTPVSTVATTSTNSTNQTANNDKKTDTAAPQANAAKKEESQHSLIIDCRTVDKDNKPKKISMSGLCKSDTLTFAYKPKFKNEEKKTTHPLKDKDKNGLWMYVTDIMDYHETSKFALEYQKEPCTLYVSSVSVLKVAVGIILAMLN